MKRTIHAVLACLLVAVSAHAATLAERSVFTQGHWWNEARPGSGLELMHADGQVMVIWYTYEASGRPAWYTAQGELAALGEAWPLLRHRWAGGRKAGAEAVGSLRLKVDSADTATIGFELHGTTGTFPIKPFMLSGLGNEVDHTGSWFDPDNSGWGVTVTEQGDVLGGVIYTYDEGGAPTWVAGFERGRRDVEMHAHTGACPGCAWTPSAARSVGRVAFDFASETRLTLREAPAIPMAAGVRVAGAALTQIARPASARLADRTLARFDAESRLHSFLAAGLLHSRSYGGVDFSASPPGTSFSQTNLVVDGVDEADLVKSDGEYVYTYAFDADGYQLPTIRIARVGADAATVAVAGSVPVAAERLQRASGGLMLHGSNLVSIVSTRAYGMGWGGGLWNASYAWVGGRTHVEIMDATDRAAPKSRARFLLDGNLVSSRRVGDSLYLVTRFVPRVDGFTTGYLPPAQRTLERANAVALADLLPRIAIDGAAPVPAVEASNVYLPPQGDRLPAADMTVVTVVDIAQARVRQTLAVAGSSDAVHVTAANLYLAGSRHRWIDTATGLRVPSPSFVTTDVHQLALTASGVSPVATGTIEGTLGDDADKAAFRINESNGLLRIVSSARGGQWGQDVSNRVTILERSAQAPGLLRTVSYLPNARRPERIGKPGELLYGTRFVGDRLYAVTFLKTDPLYVIDLSDKEDPRITGALEVPGFSDYLHPLPGNRLLGFGLDSIPASGAGDTQFAWFQGLQLALFDVSDDGKPRELQRVNIGKRGSDSALLKTHHAFSALANPDGSISFAIPARVHDGPPPAGGGWAPPTYPYYQSELLRFDVAGSRITQQPSLVFKVAGPWDAYSYGFDPAREEARSVIFGKGVLFVGGGRFWLQNASGTAGPL